MPSTHLNETLGIVFVEALATGVPIVVPDLPGPRRAASDGKCGIIVKRNESTLFANAWLSLARDANLRRRLIETGLDYATQFDRTLVYQALLTSIAKCATSNGSPFAASTSLNRCQQPAQFND